MSSLRTWSLLSLLSLPSIVAAGVGGPSPPASVIPSLRIVPLGDSITWGMGSTTGNGYREDLLQLYQQDDVEATYLGTQQHGNMTDPYNEGYPLHTIGLIDSVLVQDDVLTASQYFPLPNLILLHAGTNNWPDPSLATSQYAALLGTLRSLAPNALIMLASIVPSPDATVNERIADINNQIVTTIIPNATTYGSKIFHVDMSVVPNTSTYFYDILHPNDAGYELMSHIWYNGTLAAAKQGLIDTIS